jgi:hypothetical protein
MELPMIAEFDRDAAATAAVLGFFALSWLGWALEAPPRRARGWIIASMVVAAGIMVAGGVLAAAYWSDGTVFDADTSPIFGIVVGVEFALSGLGAWFLSSRGRSELIPPFIAVVVGVHFIPLALILEQNMLFVLAGAVTAAAVIATIAARRRGLAVSFVNGVAIGTVLWLGAAYSLGGLAARLAESGAVVGA